MAALRVGDTVNVPGGMHGTIKFLGAVDGKKGTFAGVELATEYAGRGKNSGDVGGKHYFHTTIPGGGIFLPAEKAEKRLSGSSTTSSKRATSTAGSPGAPAIARTPATGRTSMVKPSFSQSLGPAPNLTQRVASPTSGLKPRQSLARPTSPVRQPARPSSPLRKTQIAPAVQTPAAGRLTTPKTRPNVGLAKSTLGTPGTAGAATGLRAPSYATGGPNKFSQSLRQSTSQTPSRLAGRGSSMASTTTPLGPDPRFDEDDTILEDNEETTTPTPAVRKAERASGGDAERLSQESQRLKEELEHRDKQLADQAGSIAEMERSLTELQNIMSEQGALPQDEADLPKDVQSLRSQLRERNERIKLMAAEFDNNRADFRSTIDTLEMASTETERVYEQRVEDLLQQVQQLQERNEDVDSVAQQFKQLEELVQELEEGLEESRRAEAEARSEVEFLRGEVERGKSELRRERERAAAQAALEGDPSSAGPSGEDVEDLQASLQQKEDEIRGLKTMIQSLQGIKTEDRSSYGSPATPRANGIKHVKKFSSNSVVPPDPKGSSEVLQKQIHDLESLLQQKSSHEEELELEVRQLRQSVQFGKQGWASTPALGLNHRRTDSQNDKHNSGGSQKTVVGQQNGGHQRKDSTIPDLDPPYTADGRGSPLKDEYGIDSESAEERDEQRRRRSAQTTQKPPAPPSVSETSTAGQWCEICEEPGHDILSCANMMGANTQRQPSPQPGMKTGKDVVAEGLSRSNGNFPTDRPAPLRKSGTYDNPHPPPSQPLPPPPARSTSLAYNSNANFGSVGNGSGSNRSSATPAHTLSSQSTPSKPAGALIEGTGSQTGMLAGKTSGYIDPNKWCALCEKDGHDSVDCPIEDTAF